jgi:hypothetical protein
MAMLEADAIRRGGERFMNQYLGSLVPRSLWTLSREAAYTLLPEARSGNPEGAGNEFARPVTRRRRSAES